MIVTLCASTEWARRTRRPSRPSTVAVGVGLWAIAAVGLAGQGRSVGGWVQQDAPAQPCRIDGTITSGEMPLPGVSVLVRASDKVEAATSTDVAGRYAVLLRVSTTYHFWVQLAGFTAVERDVVVESQACDSSVDFQLDLAPRRESAAAGAGAQTPALIAAAVASSSESAQAPPAASLGTSVHENQRASLLTPSPPADASATERHATAESEDAADAIARLLPPGFSPEAAQSDAVPIIGRENAVRLDRAALRDRIQAGALGQLLLGGRLPPQSAYHGATTYTFGGSLLNTPPYQLRPEVPNTQPRFGQHNFGASIGGPLKVPGHDNDAKARTNFQLNYAGYRSANLFDQYATVPTAAMRRGDFSSSAIQLVDPAAGQPFDGNRIPSARIDPAAALLMRFIPLPNLPGASQNYHVSRTVGITSDSVSLRLTHNLLPATSKSAAKDPSARPAHMLISGQLQFRRNDSESLNVFPNLGGRNRSVSTNVPISLSLVRGDVIQAFTFTIMHSTARTSNAFSGVENVSGEAGINYPTGAALDPHNWGVPGLLFSGFSAVRGAPSFFHTDNRISSGFSLSRRIGSHRVNVGGGYRFDGSTSDSNANARGSFTFTGLYSSRGSGGHGADFADFLLGAPQQATLQVGGVTHLRGHAINAYVEDNWQAGPSLTLNIGLRYELVRPYVAIDGRMTNLDVAPNFAAVAPVISGGVGPFTGSFPSGLMNTDVNNVGPRLGAAYRVGRATILRGGYSVTYNLGSYAGIARQLVAQPPFAATETVIGTPSQPLAFASALLPSGSVTTNNFGVDRDYQLGRIQTWNASVTQNVGPKWTVTAGYTGVRGTALDILRAPNRGPSGLLIPGVQAFTWESSGGHSTMHAGNIQLRRPLALGVSGSLSYTLAKSMDDTSSLAAASPIVAQNDNDLASEWAASNFDRRHQLSGSLSLRLPFGTDERWVDGGGLATRLLSDWSLSLMFTAQSGTPYTARVIGQASDVMRGTNGSLRANCTGSLIQLDEPTVNRFFNVGAFAVPAAGTFGNCGRNTIVGPGGRQLDGLLRRDVRIGGNRTISVLINATNLLNTVQWATIDTNLNSPTFGQVLGVQPMRRVTLSGSFRF